MLMPEGNMRVADVGKQPGWEGEAAASPSSPSIMAELRQLIAAAKQMASTEVAYQTTRAKLMGVAAAWIAGGAVLALTLLFFVLMALVVGLLLALAPLLGAWGAMGVVVGVLLLFVVIAGLMAFSGLRRFMALLHDGKDAA